MASADDFLGAPAPKKRFDTPDIAPHIQAAATELGIDPTDLATVISYETAGTFDPDQPGPTTKWGQHRGLIQFGGPQRQKYGVVPGQTFEQQMPAVVAYLRDAGVKPGMGIMDVYSAINAGAPGRYNASDTAAGGAPGTVADKVNNQMASHRRKALALLGGGGSGGAGSVARIAADDFLGAAPAAPAPAADDFLAEAPAAPQEQGYLGGVADAIGNLFTGDQPLASRVGLVQYAAEPDIVRGVRARGAELTGKLARGVANISEPIGDALESTIPLSGLTPEQVQGEKQLQPIYDLSDALVGYADQNRYEPTTTFQDVKDAPLSAATPTFIAEQAMLSAPDMAASVAALPAYVLGRTEEIAERRVQNDATPSLSDLITGETPVAKGEPGLRDLAAAAPGAVIESLLERYATKRLPGAGTAGTAAGRVAKETAVQAGTEAVEEGAANLAESVGTQRGFKADEFLDAVGSGALVGGGIGAVARTATEVTDVAPSNAIEPTRSNAIDPTPAEQYLGDAPQQEIAQPAPQQAPAVVEAAPPAEMPPVEAAETAIQASQGAETAPVVAVPEVEPTAVEEAPARARFASPDDLQRGEFVQRATERGVPEDVATELAPKAAIDDVTGYFDGRTQGMKANTVARAQEHVRDTGESAFYVDGDIVNLGGLNKAASEDMTIANRHFRAMTDILRTELESTGADVVPMRTGGDELGAVVINGGETEVRAAMQAADAKIRDYAAQNGLDTIPHTKQGRADVGVGLHLGLSPIVDGVSPSEIFTRASAEVNQSKEASNVARVTPARTGSVAPGGQPEGIERSAGEGEAGLRSEDRGAESAEGAPSESPASEPRSTARVAAEPDAPVTGTKNEVTDAERQAEGRPEREKSASKSNEESVEEARREIKKNPGIGRDVVNRLKNAGVDGISARDEAILMAHKVDVRTERASAADRAVDQSLSEDERAAARRTYEELNLEIAEIDDAAYGSGREWGRLGQLRQKLIRDDFSLESMERKARMARNRPLTPEETTEIARQAEQIKSLQDQLEASQKAIDDAKAGEGVSTTYAQMVRDLASELGDKGQAEHPTLEKLKRGADESRAALRKLLGGTQFNSGFDPTIFYHLGRIGAYHIANGTVKLTEWVAKMRAELGAKLFKEVEPALEELHTLLKKSGGKVPVKSTEAVLSDIDPKGLRAKDVADLARVHILAGVHGEDKVMKAVHADLKKVLPEITERQVRRAFTDYGKATMPSKAADKVELRELRRLVQLQESIDRLNEGLAPLKSGLQRDKATQAVREKMTQLNDLLRQATAKYKDSPEKLASYQAARKTTLENSIADLEKQIAAGEKNKRTPPPALDETNQKLATKRDQMRKQLEALDRAKNADKITAERKKALEDQVARLKRQIEGAEPKPAPKEKPLDPPELHELKVLRDDLRKQLNAVDNPPKTPDQRYQATREKQLNRMLERVSERLRTDNYERTHRAEPRALSEKNQDVAFRLHEKKQEFLRKQFEHELSNRKPVHKAFGAVQETFNLARAIMTSVDLSAVLRQGGFIAMAHPLRALSAVPDMLRAFASEKAAFDVEDKISKRDNARLYQKYKLELTDRRSTSLSKMEEAFMSRLVDKLPTAAGGGFVRGSSRAYSTFLNLLRADSFDAMAATLARGKEPTSEEGKAIANFINAATGRGSLGKFQQSASVLNTVFFAPRWVMSRFQMLVPLQLFYGGTNRTRYLIAQEYARYLIGAAVAMALVSTALGDDDDGIASTDPRSTDFMKIKIGDVTIDPLSGLIQPTVLMTRIAMNEKTTGSGKVNDMGDVDFGEDDAFKVLVQFLRTKLAPVPGGLVTLRTGKNVIGEEQGPLEVWSSMVAPLALQDIVPIMKDAGIPRGTAIMLLSTFGMGVQYRDPEGINKGSDAGKGVESSSGRGSSRASVRNSDQRGSTR